MASYDEFLASKTPLQPDVGFDPTMAMNPHLLPWQERIVRWSIRKGRAGNWADCGLGKSLMSLEWARHVADHTDGNVLILTPLAVAKQFVREGVKFGIPVTLCRSQSDVRPGINVTNYQMLRHFKPDEFAGVVADESDILANYTGKTKQEIIAAFRNTPYKLDCSATPAPNDHLELGNHADFLGVMESNEMISRWFLNDAGEAGNYRLKKHAEQDFWRWVASWATAITRPSDLGYEDGGFELPPLNIFDHCVGVDHSDGREDGMLFRLPSLSATGLHKELRRTTDGRAEKAAEVVASKDDVPWVVWCNTDYEADALRKVIPKAVEIRGSETVQAKEAKVESFLDGSTRILIAKPAMIGHGLNLQHCRDAVYVGLSYSFKYQYQSIRRFWRFGQTQPVNVHFVSAETEGHIGQVVERKRKDHEIMKRSMVSAMAEFGLGMQHRRDLTDYEATVSMSLPAWLTVS